MLNSMALLRVTKEKRWKIYFLVASLVIMLGDRPLPIWRDA